jgi:hypothetical protein
MQRPDSRADGTLEDAEEHEDDAGSDIVVPPDVVSDGGCPAGHALCDDACLDVRNDVRNCGDCGVLCPTPANAAPSCARGVCGLSCNPGYADCNGNPADGCEVELASSPENCGACGMACPSGNVCMAGRCSGTCDPPLGNCMGACVDVRSNVRHCGGCGVTCNAAPNASPTCASSRCGIACNAGFADCNVDPGDGCETDTPMSVNHCGACNRVCPGGANARALCAGGICSLTCAAGYSDCDGNSANGCEVNTQNNPSHCGACGFMCPRPANATATCNSSICGFACTAGYADCDGNSANGCEVNLLNTAAHCGACGRTCTAGPNATATCNSGNCTRSCLPGYADCNGDPNDGCEVNILTSNASCGGCGLACTGGPNTIAACSSGSCIRTCVAGYADCNGNLADGCEINTNTSASNCGACGRTCSLANATSVCSAGSCAINVCSTGFANCDGLASNGCEINTRTDLGNCGTCGNVCPTRANATRTCNTGSCSFTCSTGFGNCDSDATNGCETDVRVSVSHCGSCGNACPARPNALATCSGSSCGISCLTGFGNCDSNNTNGCEADLRTSTSHCGACGRACVLSNATSACDTGACTIAACNPGYADCDGNATNGCEANEQSSPLHCGGCGMVCPVPTEPNRVATCGSGTCGTACAPGFGDCDGDLSNGCEMDLRTTSNCGACGRVCSAGQLCLGGNCTAGSITSYSLSSSPQTFLDACAVPGHAELLTGAADDSTVAITLPFEFLFYAARGTAAWISSNGVVGFGSTASNSWSNVCLPSTDAPRNALFAFWDDLVGRTRVCTAMVGSGTSRQFVITWEDMQFYSVPSDHMTFSAVLSEGTQVVDVIYRSLSGSTRAFGDEATIGVQNAAGTVATQFSCNTRSLSAGTAIRFTPM